MHPSFWGVQMVKSKLVKNLFFNPIKIGKLNSDYRIQKSRGNFRKKIGRTSNR
jgi:hypothetical protein